MPIQIELIPYDAACVAILEAFNSERDLRQGVESNVDSSTSLLVEAKKASLIFLARSGPTPVGVGMLSVRPLHWYDQFSYYIGGGESLCVFHSGFVREAYSGQGVQRALIDARLDQARRAGFAETYIKVRAEHLRGTPAVHSVNRECFEGSPLANGSNLRRRLSFSGSSVCPSAAPTFTNAVRLGYKQIGIAPNDNGPILLRKEPLP